MTSADTIVTRFAPSPTGMLHIGGARTALFSWLFAKHHGGRFLLRIEDTDKARSTQEAIDAIVEGMTWLDLSWDGDIVYQSQRDERHAEVAQMMVAEGAAYYCYCSPEELEDMRAEARATGKPMRSRWRDAGPEEAPSGVAPVVRLRAERSGETLLNDLVQGAVAFQNEQLDDFVLVRSDGSPTYMLSVVVDDHDMGITHVIRGDDHLNNAARQLQLFKALGWPVPTYAHIPLIHGPDGAKLSKRHGALGVQSYREMGYLPPALMNYLLRLGWSHGDDEIISREQAIEWFSLDAVNKGAARFDFDKLNHINAHYLRSCDEEILFREVDARLAQKTGAPLSDAVRQRIQRVLPDLVLRAKTLAELAEAAAFLLAERPLVLTDKARKQITPESAAVLGRVHEDLSGLDRWDDEALEDALRGSAEGLGIGFGKVGQPLRAALTGGANSPGLAQVMVALGREETLARIADQVSGAARA